MKYNRPVAGRNFVEKIRAYVLLAARVASSSIEYLVLFYTSVCTITPATTS